MTLSRRATPAKLADDTAPNSAEILADTAIDQIISKKLDAQLQGESPLVVLIEVTSRAWTDALRQQLARRYPETCVRSYHGEKRSVLKQEEDHLLASLSDGQTVIALSTDLVGNVPEPLRGVADLVLRFPGLTSASLQKAIRLVTGLPLRRPAKVELASLDLPDIAAAIRPRSMPSECVKRLKIAVERKSHDLGLPDDAVPVTSLPLSPEVRVWADEVLSQLRLLEQGKISMRCSPFAVLAGPPGGGKSKLAESIAKEAGWRLVTTSAQSWFDRSDGFLGGVARQTNAFFQSLEHYPKTIGLIEELDAVPDRAALDARNREWWTPIVTGILLQIDQLRRSSKPALLLGATNFPDRLDAALTRHGRLGRLVNVHPPRNLNAITKLFRYYLKDELGQGDINRLVHMSMAFGMPTPATIESWVGSARIAAMAAGRALSLSDLETAIGGVDERSQAELFRVAVHEAGHAIVAAHLGVPISSVSILAQPGSAGSLLAEVRTTDLDRPSVENLVMVALAGRAADQILLGFGDAAATSDLKMATRLLYNAHFGWGLFDQLAAVDVNRDAPLDLDPEARLLIDTKLQELMLRTKTLVKEHREAIERLAGALLRARVISGTAVRDLVLNSVVSGPPPREEAQP